MCTSIFLETKDNKHLLARTMDFSFPLDFDVVYLPKRMSGYLKLIKKNISLNMGCWEQAVY